MEYKLNYLENYLYINKIKINLNDFYFQLDSHPNSQSLLSISDTLTFFNIENAALNIPFEEIELLPSYFIALLENINDKPTFDRELYFLKKENNNYFIQTKNKFVKITNEELKKRWQNTVLLVEKKEENKSNKNNTPFSKIVSVIFLIMSVFYVVQLDNTIGSKLFLILPVLGFILSISALKDLFGTKFELIDKFCNFSNATSCNSVINSKKWQLFKWFNFSDLSITFFTFQIISLLISIATKQNEIYFSFLKIILIFSFPIIGISIYYQKFIEKKWCPICLLISSVLISETLILFFFDTDFTIELRSIWLLALFVLIYFIWINLKKIIANNKELKEFKIKANRFIRNYDLFKNNLFSTNKVDLIDSELIFGNKQAKICITLITNPFCGHCEKVHEIIDLILLKNAENIKVKILIKTSLEVQSELNKEFYRTFYNLYHQKGIQTFSASLKYWYKTKNVENWLKIYKTDNSNSMKIDAVYGNVNTWGINNNFNYTPAVFINGYEYPIQYERENLIYYIDDLIEDTDFN